MDIDAIETDVIFKQWVKEHKDYVEYISSVFGVSEYHLRNVFFWGMGSPRSDE